MFRNIVRFGMALVSVALLGFAAVALTADEIMDMVDAEADAQAAKAACCLRFDLQ